ncbi:P1 family peptidase [Arthrobacter sp. H14]|uniref:P1 family peptidase n=1 Tax=Arthrobacter sp. H14 TaxID=1312959 RepID=UPI0004B94A12|nr:P1 family peptidase [Arthrobacter sp. H14]
MVSSITDVPGIRVGHAQRTDPGWLTGVTVVLPPPGTVGSVDVRGGGPGTHETDALDPTTLVPTVDAVVLTGGSAYGLATAQGVQRWCEEQGKGFPVPGGVVPIVPAAAIFDLGRGGEFGNRPDAGMGYAAVVAAAAEKDRHDVDRGNVGGGTGAVLAQGKYKGGTGTASVRLDGNNTGIVIGAIAVVNAVGSPIGSSPLEADGAGTGGSLNTTLVVVATNAVLDPAQCKRTATAAHAGLARSLNPVHTLADGDTIFTLATGERALSGDGAAVVQSVMQLQAAAADAVELAVRDAVEHAEAVNNGVIDLPRWPG